LKDTPEPLSTLRQSKTLFKNLTPMCLVTTAALPMQKPGGVSALDHLGGGKLDKGFSSAEVPQILVNEQQLHRFTRFKPYRERPSAFVRNTEASATGNPASTRVERDTVLFNTEAAG
jgi:hypothetical protein